MVMSNFKHVIDYRLVKMGLQELDYFLGHRLRTITERELSRTPRDLR